MRLVFLVMMFWSTQNLKSNEKGNQRSHGEPLQHEVECSHSLKHCGLTVKELKICFHNYVETHQPTYVHEFGTQLHLF